MAQLPFRLQQEFQQDDLEQYCERLRANQYVKPARYRSRYCSADCCTQESVTATAPPLPSNQ